MRLLIDECVDERLLILCAPTNRLRDLERLVPAGLAALNANQPGEVVRIS
jgi:hypothetical protein